MENNVVLARAPQAYLPSAPAALKSLKELERQGTSAKSYEELKKLIGVAEAIKLMHKEMLEIRQEAEWTILSLRQELGKRIDENVPKGNKHQIQPGLNLIKRRDLPMNHQTRAYLLKLAKLKKPQLRRLVEDLWATMHDATLKAVIEISQFGDFKKERANREKILAEKIRKMPEKRYGVILADPEWKFKTYSDKGKVMTSAERHYPTSSLADIKKRKPPAAKDCVLFLWGTAPMLPQALEVLDAWGFEYVTNIAWDKEKTGTGYWVLNQHEHLLIGKRGKVVPPAMGTQWPSVIRERATRHSAKPEKAYKLIEEYYPNMPKIELNQRKARDGWDGWGNEAT